MLQSSLALLSALEHLYEKCLREKAIYEKSLHGLREVRREISLGPRHQALELEQLLLRIKRKKKMPRPKRLWNQLRDIYSLHPQNVGFLEIFNDFLRWCAPDDINRLSQYIAGRHVFLHLSCQARSDLARASISSFARPPSDEIHLMCVGSSNSECPFISFSGNVLTLNVSDDYEYLHRKTFMTFAIISIIAEVKAIFKCDDDISMTNRNRLNNAKLFIEQEDVQYAGLARSIDSHKQFYHGWHVGKCKNKAMHRRGIQIPLPRTYADGGLVYILKSKALREISYTYFSQRWFADGNIVGIEDAALGLVMQSAGIPLTPVDLTGHFHKSKMKCLAILRDIQNGIQQHHSRWSSITGRTRGDEWVIFKSRLLILKSWHNE